MVADVLYITLSNFIWFMMLHCVIVCYPAGPSIPQINVPNVPHIMARGSLWAQILAHFGHNFFKVHFGHKMGSLWAHMAHFGHIWAHFGHKWAHFGHKWAHFGHKWDHFEHKLGFL